MKSELSALKPGGWDSRQAWQQLTSLENQTVAGEKARAKEKQQADSDHPPSREEAPRHPAAGKPNLWHRRRRRRESSLQAAPSCSNHPSSLSGMAVDIDIPHVSTILSMARKLNDGQHGAGVGMAAGQTRPPLRQTDW